MRKNYLYKKDNYNIQVFDILSSDVENDAKTGEFICAGVYGKIGDEVVDKYFTDIDEYNHFLLMYDIPNVKITFYNLSYDEAFLRNIVNDANILRNQSRVIKIKLDKAEIIDIQNISGIEYTLEKWIDYLDLEKKYNIRKVDFSDIRLRVMNDTKATWHLSVFIQEFFNSVFQIQLKDTIGACALEIFKCRFLKYDIVRELESDEIADFERESLGGGRCEIFLRGDLDVISYDVRSMYVSIMRDSLIPIPNKYKYITDGDYLEKNYRKYMEHYLSILDVTVSVPNQKIAPLPSHVKVDNIKKVIYPCGVFRGTYTNVELLNAEKYGLKILKVHRMIYYYRSEYLFKDFALKVWDMRVKHNRKCMLSCPKCTYDDYFNGENPYAKCAFSVKNPDFNKAIDTMVKKVGNSLFGKFSQHVPIVMYYGRESQIPDELKPYLADSDNYVMAIYEYFDELYIDLHSKLKKDSKFTFTVISAFITSYARIKLLNAMKEVEKYVVYCDTDSIKILNVDGAFIENGKDLGNFMMEYAKREKFYAPKFYGNKTKGISKNKRQVLENNTKDGYIKFSFEKPFKFRSAIRQNKKMASWEIIIKQVDLWDDKRLWDGELFYNQGIYSRPYYLNSGDNKEISIYTKNI